MTDGKCVLYRITDKYVSHLFLTCKEVSPICNMINEWIRVHLVHKNLVKNHLLGF